MRTHFIGGKIAHAVVALALAGLFFAVETAGAQQEPPPLQGAASQTSPLDNSTSSATSTAESNNFGEQRTADSPLISASLPADRIISILEENPDLVTEIKSQVADRLQTQGTPVDANDISDEMLYQQIESNASLRSSITTFLRARGYVSEDDLQNASLSQGGSGSDTDRLGNAYGFPGDDGSDMSRLATSSSYGMVQRGREDDFARAMDTGRFADRGARAGLPARPRDKEPVNNATDAPKVLRQPAPYNLRSMRDLYTQIPDQTQQLKRFGAEVFTDRSVRTSLAGGSTPNAPLDVPLGPDYVLAPGDTVAVNVWGGLTQTISRVINGDGHILLPEAGSISVAGLTLERAQYAIENALKQQFRNAQVAVTISRLHSVRVFVVGDVQRPGGYDLNALATPVSALHAAGGPTAAGSLRTVRHYRGEQLVEEVDLYDFLLHGVRYGSKRFENGDSLLVPPVGPQVAISGAVRRPAIYELKANTAASLASVVEDAGGFTAAASFSHIVIERIDTNQRRETLTVAASSQSGVAADSAAMAAFDVKDGDRVKVEPVLPYSQRAVYLEGHVARPGRLAYFDGMRLGDVIRSYRDLLPEPADRGEIVRLVAPDLHAELIDFSVPEVLAGNHGIELQPFDTVRILGRYQLDAPKVEIRGEVLRPGKYPLSSGMTAAQLVRMAGGFKRDALEDTADLTSYGVIDGKRISEQLSSIRIGDAVSGTASADVELKAGDVLAIHQITGWNDIGESVTVEGQVRYPGSFGFQDGERLSSVLRRAGGLLPAAYPAGAVLVREQVRELEQKSREELIRQIETNSAAARLSPNLGAGDTGPTLQLIKAQQDQVLADLKSHPPSGRMVIHITADLNSWANTPADIELRRGDVITIPKVPGFVLVTGQVYNSTALTFTPGKTAGWYLRRAGGTNSAANRKDIFVIRANGTVVGRGSGGIFDDVLSTKLDPGDVVVVPQKVIGSSLFWRNLLATAQLASSIAITAAVASI
ncbi:SLBB domain-containing protein [Silvibacterium acidisoli]|uniref:SLBB domain-containing protein n=1 Tax=Acidobacteriaceae bacterium ZG23-2 TaxID=2883246 RepID=UPI00406D0FA5